MKTTILVVGDSPLSFLLARELNQSAAEHVHVTVVYLSREAELYYPPGLHSGLNPPPSFTKAAALKQVEVKIDEPKSVNLAEKRLIAKAATHPYDFLILDLTPVYTLLELDTVRLNWRHLLSAVQAAVNLKKITSAHVSVGGQTVASYQLALALASDLARAQAAVRRRVSLSVEQPTDELLGEFLRDAGLGFEPVATGEPTLHIAGPKSPLAVTKVKGLPIDERQWARTDAFLHPQGHRETMIIDWPGRAWQNLLRSDQVLAWHLIKNLEASVEKLQPVPLDEHQSPSFLLKAPARTFLWFDGVKSDRLRARGVERLDRKAWQKLSDEAAA